jgi:DNA-binding NarL/FixJ family response regulator
MKQERQSTKPVRPLNQEKQTCSVSSRRRQVMLVDDHPMTRAGLAQLINKQPDLQVCCEAGDPSEAFQALSKVKPDLIVSDITMPGRSGVEFIKDILAIYDKMPILVLSMHDEAMYAERLLRTGARGYIMKEAGGEKLLGAIRRVLSGQVYVSERMSATLLDSMTGHRPVGLGSPIEKLSDREFEIFQLIGQGKSTRDIAAQLHLSPKTVDVHRAHIKEKLELKDSTSLVRHAVRWVETGPTKN